VLLRVREGARRACVGLGRVRVNAHACVVAAARGRVRGAAILHLLFCNHLPAVLTSARSRFPPEAAAKNPFCVRLPEPAARLRPRRAPGWRPDAPHGGRRRGGRSGCRARGLTLHWRSSTLTPQWGRWASARRRTAWPWAAACPAARPTGAGARPQAAGVHAVSGRRTVGGLFGLTHAVAPSPRAAPSPRSRLPARARAARTSPPPVLQPAADLSSRSLGRCPAGECHPHCWAMPFWAAAAARPPASAPLGGPAARPARRAAAHRAHAASQLRALTRGAAVSASRRCLCTSGLRADNRPPRLSRGNGHAPSAVAAPQRSTTGGASAAARHAGCLRTRLPLRAFAHAQQPRSLFLRRRRARAQNCPDGDGAASDALEATPAESDVFFEREYVIRRQARPARGAAARARRAQPPSPSHAPTSPRSHAPAAATAHPPARVSPAAAHTHPTPHAPATR
jgi:hypothetical protein